MCMNIYFQFDKILLLIKKRLFLQPKIINKNQINKKIIMSGTKANKTFVLLLAMLFISQLSVYAQNNDDPDTKNDLFRAQLVFNVAEQVIWPSEDTINTFTIGVYSHSKSVYNHLITLAKDLKIKDKPVKIYFFFKYKQIEPVNVLYIGFDKRDDIFRVNDFIEGKSILLITDRLDEEFNYMVNILPFGGVKKIEIDRQNIEAHNLKITDELIYHGGDEDDIKDLFTKQRKELDKQIEQLQKNNEEIKKLQAQLEIEKKNLEEKKLEIQKQKEKLQQMTLLLKMQQDSLLKNKDLLKQQERIMQIKQIELQKKVKELTDKQALLDSKNAEINAKQKELADLESKIEESKNQLTQANQQIETQKGMLLIGAIFLSVILIFSIFLWQALRKNSRMNKELQRKNKEISAQKDRIQHQAVLLEQTNKELEKLSIVAENAQNGVVIMDKYGNFEWINAGFTKMYGYTLQLLINERDKNIITASSNPQIEKYVNQCIEKKENVTYEVKTSKRNGEEIWVKTTLTPILNENDEIERLVAIDTDITEIKQAQKQIEKQAEILKQANQELEKLSVVVRATDNIVLITDGKGYIEWVNPAFTQTFGYTLEEFTAKVSQNIVSDSSQQEVKDKIALMYKTKKPVTYQLLTHNKDNQEIWLQANVTPILDEKQNIIKIIVVDSDITAIKKAEKEILEKNFELTRQKEHIEQQNKQISASIKYAQTIQHSILPVKSVVDNYFVSEILFYPKDVVSGDFYWFYHNPNIQQCYAATVDCTGHGVPGAFMSLISSRILNEIVIKRDDLLPSEILEQTDEHIRNALSQDVTNNNDGLDIVLTRIRKSENSYELAFAGAKRDLYIYKKNSDNIITLKGTRRSIGGVRKRTAKRPFETITENLASGDIIYLMTDGFIDQNDKKRKRFGTNKVIELIENVKNLPISEQRKAFVTALENQLDGTEQRDDITVWIIQLR